VTDASHAPSNDPHGAAGGHVSHKRTYMQIFVWLTILTGIEVGLVYIIDARFVLITLLCALAIIKAALVAMFFMHLRFEKRTLALVVCIPLLLAGILILGLMPDSQSWFIQR
jgi:cytochrome c oxidase subunit 4